jgi:hypothetical protein
MFDLRKYSTDVAYCQPLTRAQETVRPRGLDHMTPLLSRACTDSGRKNRDGILTCKPAISVVHSFPSCVTPLTPTLLPRTAPTLTRLGVARPCRRGIPSPLGRSVTSLRRAHISATPAIDGRIPLPRLPPEKVTPLRVPSAGPPAAAGIAEHLIRLRRLVPPPPPATWGTPSPVFGGVGGAVGGLTDGGAPPRLFHAGRAVWPRLPVPLLPVIAVGLGLSGTVARPTPAILSPLVPLLLPSVVLITTSWPPIFSPLIGGVLLPLPFISAVSRLFPPLPCPLGVLLLPSIVKLGCTYRHRHHVRSSIVRRGDSR